MSSHMVLMGNSCVSFTLGSIRKKNRNLSPSALLAANSSPRPRLFKLKNLMNHTNPTNACSCPSVAQNV